MTKSEKKLPDNQNGFVWAGIKCFKMAKNKVDKIFF